MSGLAPTCNYRCPEPKGTRFPRPCKLYRPPSAEAAALWRLDQCRKTVREGELELTKRREALHQAEIALAELAREGEGASGSEVRATTNLRDFPTGEPE